MALLNITGMWKNKFAYSMEEVMRMQSSLIKAVTCSSDIGFKNICSIFGLGVDGVILRRGESKVVRIDSSFPL